MIGMTNAGGGKGIGAKLTVTAPVNTNVTAKLGSQSKIINSGSGGKAIFNGLDQGSWNVSIANSQQTVTIPVTITTDYFTTIAFFSAKIVVTYPSGSTCTCTNGSTTYTATSTSGSYTFTVPWTGTWTVKCTNGSSTASQNVSITATGQSVSVTLSYWDGTLYPTGTPGDTLSGGWDYKLSLAGAPEFNSSRIYYNAQNATAYIYTKNAIDVTNFKTLSYKGTLVGHEGTSAFGLAKRQNEWQGSMDWVAKATQSGYSDMYDQSVNISSLSGKYYVVIYAGSGGQGVYISVNNVWLK